MDERVMKFQVGVVLLAASAAALVLIMLVGAWPHFFKSYYTIDATFPSAPGVARDTPVLKSGIHIGRVKSVELQEDGRVLLALEIEAKYKIRKNESCRVSRGSIITGDAVIEFFLPPTAQPSDLFLKDQDSIRGQVAGDPFEVFTHLEDDMASAIASIQHAGTQVSDLASTLNDLIGENGEKIRSIIDKTDAALVHVAGAAKGLDQLLGDPEINQQIRQTLAKLPALFEDAEKTLAQTRQTLDTFREVSAGAQRTLSNLENLTAPLADRADELAENLAGSVRNINRLLAEVVDFTRALNEGDGTLSALAHDRELYDNIKRIVRNAEEATERIRPVLADLRVLTDKLARDPRMLGVKGALDRRPAGAGTKWPLGPR